MRGVLPLRDRAAAGRLLADALRPAAAGPAPLVLALPRGGVAVAAPIAAALGAALDVLPVRKIGLPGQPELAVAALVDGDPPWLERHARLADGDTPAWLADAVAEAGAALAAQRLRWRGGRPLAVAGRAVLLVDDGLATGTTMAAALRAVRRAGAASVGFAVPVAPRDTLARLRGLADACCVLATPDPFGAVGAHYRDFHQLDDAEVQALLAAAAS